MNIHHLELFYYVARHGGVSAAARSIPYGIQQPAISAQIIQLEDNLGKTLFHRRPFQLTKAGEELYAFIEPFFGGLPSLAIRLRGGVEAEIRIGASETIQREYLPRLLLAMQKRVPGLHFTLVAVTEKDIAPYLLAQKIDLAVGPIHEPQSKAIQQKELLQVGMALAVPFDHPLQSAEELWQQDRISEPLITGENSELLPRLFQVELEKRKIEWFSSLELTSQDLIVRYVAEGFGVGLVLIEPGAVSPPNIRLLPLIDFQKISYGLHWTGLLSPVQTICCEEAASLAKIFPNY